jgi:hypothetical protein
MSDLNEKIDEIIEFFEDETSWDREGLVDDILHLMPIFKGIPLDEISIEHHAYLTDLEDFANDFFNGVLERIVVAIETFKEE